MAQKNGRELHKMNNGGKATGYEGQLTTLLWPQLPQFEGKVERKACIRLLQIVLG